MANALAQRIVDPLLEHHDRRQFEVFCYASVRTPDEITSRLRSCADIWRDVVLEDDAKLADQVTISFGGNSRTVARAGMVLGHALDLAYHYSQLANYMRLNNILPPTALPRPRPAGS